MSSLNDDLFTLGGRVAESIGAPRVSGLHLPRPVSDETFRDAFGFVFLDDGSVGPFYVSLDDMLVRLWRRVPQPAEYAADPLDLLHGLRDTDPVARGLAIGTYNALGAALMRRAGFEPPARGGGSSAPAAGARVGMVGWFAPLVERLLAAGSEVWVLERAPQRVEDRRGVRLCDDVAALRGCDHVLCTAATLVNDTLPGLLDALAGKVAIELVGPTGSGLPDALFAHGVSAVGGVGFAGREALLAQLAAGRKWGEAGRKFQLDATSYPGVDALLQRLSGSTTRPGGSE